jgi:poly(3-hydroxybutyrate) depolymerase
MLIAAGQDELHWYGTAYSTGGVLQIQFANNRDGIFTAAHYQVSTIGDENTGTIIELDCMLIDPDTGVDPQINVGLSEFRGGLWSAGKGGPAWSTFGSPPAVYDASWQSGGTIKNPGVAFLCNGTAAVSWAGELQILSHPWDKEA